MHAIPILRKLVCIRRHRLTCLNQGLLLGQGMNASMNDSHNLGMRVSDIKIPLFNITFSAWKLTHVLRGWAKLSLLKTVIEFHSDFACLFIEYCQYLLVWIGATKICTRPYWFRQALCETLLSKTKDRGKSRWRITWIFLKVRPVLFLPPNTIYAAADRYLKDIPNLWRV